MFVPRAIKRPSSTPVKTSKKVKNNSEEVEEPIKEYSCQQREASTGEPACVVCGKYGEYICDETEHDVCSIECKKIDIERTKKITNNTPEPLPNVIQPVLKYSHNIADTTFVSGDLSQMLLQVPSDLFHAQLTAYLPHPEIKVLSSFQVQSILLKNQIIVQGKNIPRPITKFEHCKLPPKMADNLQQVGYLQPTEIQMQVIPTGLVGRDILASAQTGSGKTAAFLIPIIIHTWTISQFVHLFSI
ncbi:17107_t:CDS:2, partial [Dentiscutata heterogama]